jgi:predicted metal-dependent hydrolase
MIEDEAVGNDRPPYSYVPGGPWPHPIGDPGGHSFGRRGGVVPPIVGDGWRECPAYLRGVALFNDGYYWEAHEAWEPIWHAHRRHGPTADVIRALIKLAAAGVKVREGQPRGVSTHATRAAALLESTAAEVGPFHLGLDLERLAAIARRLAERPPTAASGKEAAVAVVFDFRIEPA